MSTQPSTFTLGITTEAQMLAKPELAPTDYVNTAGVPDTKEDCNTRANAVYPRFVREFIRQVNNVFLGTQIVPGISGVSGKSWRPGDDGANTVVAFDIASYAITNPTAMWVFDQTLLDAIGSNTMVSSDPTRDGMMLINARGGVNGEARFVYAARTMYGVRLRSTSNPSGIGQTMTFAGFVTLSEWNQSPDGIILAAHRDYNSTDEVGVASRLGFELGLGYASVTETADSLVLYYRHRNSSDAEVVRYVVVGGAAHVSIPMGREVFVAFKRTATTLEFYLNGLLLYSTTFSAGNEPSPGNGADMRLLLGGDWNGTRYLNGGFRNVAIWTGTQPSAAELLSYYRIGAGFIPKGLPA